MGKSTKNVRHVRQLDTFNLYARSYAVRLAKQGAEEGRTGA